MIPLQSTTLVSRSVFVVTAPGSHAHATRVAGVTVLERVLREAAGRGVTRAVVAVPSIPLPPLPVEVEWVPPSTPIPQGMEVVRGDLCCGILVSDDRSRREAERRLVRSLRRGFDGPVDALINRRISSRCSLWLSRTAITPNEVTVAAIGVGLAAAFLAALGRPWTLVAAGLLIQGQSVLDCCDGELARLTFRGSRLGQWLDNVSDDVVDNLFLVGAGIATNRAPWLAAALVGAASRTAAQVWQYREVKRKTGTGDVYAFRWWFEADKATLEEVYNPASPLTWLRSLGRRDTYAFVWMVMCLVSWPEAIVVHGLGLGLAFAGLTIVDRVFKRRQVSGRS